LIPTSGMHNAPGVTPSGPTAENAFASDPKLDESGICRMMDESIRSPQSFMENETIADVSEPSMIDSSNNSYPKSIADQGKRTRSSIYIFIIIGGILLVTAGYIIKLFINR
jgi:hypothetical protein